MLIAVDDAGATIGCWLALEHDRDVSAFLQHHVALRLIGLGTREGQVIVGRQFALRMRQGARWAFGVIDELNISIVAEDVRRHALPCDIGCAIETDAKLEIGARSCATRADDAGLELAHERRAIAHEHARLGGARGADRRHDAATGMRAETQIATWRGRPRAKIADSRG